MYSEEFSEEEEFLPMDAMSIYYRQMPKRLLSFEEERYYFKMLKEGNLEYREKLIEGNLQLAKKIAGEFYFQGIIAGLEKADLIQEANLALTKAVDLFDYRLNIKFVTYAYKAMVRRLRATIQKYNNIKYGMIYLDEVLEGNEVDNYNFIIIEKNPVEKEVFKNNLEKIVLHLYNCGILSYKEFTIIKLKNGLFGFEPGNCEQEFKVSRQRINEILCEAYKKIRSYLSQIDKKDFSERVKNDLKEKLKTNPTFKSMVKPTNINEEKISASCKAVISSETQYIFFLKIFDSSNFQNVIEEQNNKIMLHKLGFINKKYYTNEELSLKLNINQIEIEKIFEESLKKLINILFSMIDELNNGVNEKFEYVPNYIDFIFGYLNVYKYFEINGAFEQFLKLRYGLIDGICLSESQISKILSLTPTTLNKYYKYSLQMLVIALSHLFESAIDFDKKRSTESLNKNKVFTNQINIM